MVIGKSDVLLVIDMQNVYLPQNQWECEGITGAISYIGEVLEKFPEDQVIFTRFMAPEHPQGTWKEYNRVNGEINRSEELNAPVQELQKYMTSENTFYKSTYSCISNAQLLEKLMKYDTVYITGVVAECCVLATVFELIDMGKKIVFLRNGIAGESIEKARAVEYILEGLSPMHVMFV